MQQDAAESSSFTLLNDAKSNYVTTPEGMPLPEVQLLFSIDFNTICLRSCQPPPWLNPRSISIQSIVQYMLVCLHMSRYEY